MKLLAPVLLGAALLLSGCPDGKMPSPPSRVPQPKAEAATPHYPADSHSNTDSAPETPKH